jgi:hypothetical protein
MGEAIGEILPLAVGIALSPVSVIAVILMLFSGRARTNSVVFLVGWLVGIVAACTIMLAVARTQDLTTGSAPSAAASWIKLALGVLLLLLAIKQWRSRPAPGAEATFPGWMSKIDSMKSGAALGLGVLLCVANPKNLLLILGAAVLIAQAGLPSDDEAVTVAVFTIVAASSVAIPTLAYLLAGSRVQPALDRMKAWLAVNNTAVMAVLLLVLGVSLLGKGLGGLI